MGYIDIDVCFAGMQESFVCQEIHTEILKSIEASYLQLTFKWLNKKYISIEREVNVREVNSQGCEYLCFVLFCFVLFLKSEDKGKRFLGQKDPKRINPK